MAKDTEIKKEIAKLNKIFKDIPEDKKKLCEGLIENAAFMRCTLNELQKEVVEKGAVIQYTSGNGFESIRDNPAQKAYTTMVARYGNVINQLSALLPDTKQDVINKAGEALFSFATKGKNIELH